MEQHVDVVAVLVDAGANVDLQDADRNNPLLLAGENGDVALLRGDPDLTATNRYRRPRWCHGVGARAQAGLPGDRADPRSGAALTRRAQPVAASLGRHSTVRRSHDRTTGLA